MNANSQEHTDHTTDGAIVSPSFAFGISTGCINSVHYLEEQRLLYPAGQFFVSLSADDGKSTFIPTAAGAQAVLLQLSANKRYLAAAERVQGSEQQQVSVYNVPTQKREQTLPMGSHTKSNAVAAISFSGDTKLLVTLTGEPDWTVFLWRWQQAKVVMTLSADSPALAACISLWDEGMLAVASLHTVKAHRVDIRACTYKTTNAMMLDSHKSTTITCLCHLVGGMMAVGTSIGKIMICSPTGVLTMLDICPASSRQGTSSGAAAPTSAPDDVFSQAGSRSSSVRGAVQAASPSGSSSPKRGKSSVIVPWQEVLKDADRASTAAAGAYAVQAVVQRGRGFVAAGSMGDVYLFSPLGTGGGRGSGHADAFSISHKFMFVEQPQKSLSATLAASSTSGQAPLIRAGSSDGSSESGPGDSSMFSRLPPALRLCGLTVSPTDEELAVTTAAGKLMLLNITAAVEAQEEAAGLGAEVEADAAGDAADGAAATSVAPGGDAGEADAGDCGQDCQEQSPEWQVVASGFPTSRVVGLDAVQHLPLLLVASQDGSVRVYDWMRRTRLAVRHMGARHPLSCSLHPSGLMAAVGTNESLSVFWILKGAMSPVAELPVVKCSITRYSHTGGLLAAAGSSNTIIVYPAYYGYEGAAGRASNCRPTGQSRSAAVAAGSGEGGAVLEAIAVLKGHVSSVTDLVFTGDDKRLVSTGAGGAVYFWDLSTGTRLTELEYVDKKCIYCSACFNDQDAAAIVRTMDGRLQHLKDGQLVYEASGLSQDCCPIALTGDGRVVLAATGTGSVVSIGWPQHPIPPAAANQLQEDDLDFDGILSFSGAARPSAPSPVAKLSRGFKNLSVQVGAGSSGSPRDHSNKSTPRMQLQGPVAACSPARSAQVQDSSKASPAAAAGAQQHAPSCAGGGGTSGLGLGRHEYRLHATRITAIKVLHNAGIMFTASADGEVLMSSLTLVLDGVLIEPPPPTLPLSATVQGSIWALATLGLSAAGTSNQAGLPPPLVLVDDSIILCLQDRIKALLQRVAAMQRDAQYQVLRQTQALKDSLSFSSNQVAALTAELEQLRSELEQCRQKAVTDQEQILKELEGLHLSAAEQLEGLYEARLALERERLKQVAAAKDDVELSLKEAMKRQASAAQRELAEVHSMYQQQLTAETDRTEAAAMAAAEANVVWHEVLMQTEEDLEKRAQTDSERLSKLQRTAEETQVKLRAEANILSRANERLKAEKATDAARVSALQQEVRALHQQLTDAGSVADKLRAELGERDGVINDNHVSLQGLKRRVQELETHKFVLTHKNEAAAAELQPKEEQLERIQATVNAQDKELLAGRSALLAAQRAVAERSAAVASAKQELWEAKRKMAHQSALLDAVAYDVAYVLQQPEECVPGGKTASRGALEKLAVKYCTKRGGGPRTSVQVEAEMMAHIAVAEKKSNILERQLNQALTDKHHSSRRLLADNNHLLADVAELQRSNKELSQQLAAATRQLAALQCQQQDVAVGGAGLGSRPGSAASGIRQGAKGPSVQKVGRSQGVRMGGQLIPAREGRYFEAAMYQQWKQLADLQTALEATASLVVMQAAQLAGLQQRADAEGQQQQAAPAESPTWQAELSWQRPAAPQPGTHSQSSSPLQCFSPSSRPRTAEGDRPFSASPSKSRGASPLMMSHRAVTAGHLGMATSIKSDLAAWRVK